MTRSPGSRRTPAPLRILNIALRSPKGRNPSPRRSSRYTPISRTPARTPRWPAMGRDRRPAWWSGERECFGEKISQPFDRPAPRQIPPVPTRRAVSSHDLRALPRRATPARRRARASTATATAAVSGVVLCVADGIVRIAASIIRAAARLSGGINLLIGVAAGEDKRCDHDRDAEPHGRFATH